MSEESLTAENEQDKIVSSQKHAKEALEVTSKAAQAAYETGVKHATAAVTEGKEHLTRAVDAGKQHLGAAAKDLREAAVTRYSAVRVQVEKSTQDYYGKAQQAWNDATVKARNFQSDSEDFIREKPLQSVGIALGAGFLIGLLIRK